MPLDQKGKDLSEEDCQHWFTIFQKLGLLWQSKFSHLCLEVGLLAAWILRWPRLRILL